MRVEARIRRRLAGVVTALLVAGGIVVAGAAPAQAAVEDGVYTGENSHGYDISVTVQDGMVTNVDTVATVFCISGIISVPFPTQFIGNPPIPIAADGSFSANWTHDVDADITNHYWIGGVISGDTITSAGSNAADMVMTGMACSGSQFTYTAALAGEPATMTVAPNPITPAQYADPGLTVRGENFVPSTEVDFSMNGQVLGQAPVDENGVVEITNTWSSATLGDHVLRISGNGRSAEATVTVAEQPVVYDPSVELTPSSVSVSDLAGSGVVVSGSGFPEGAAAEVLFDGAVVGSVTTNAGGAMSFDLVRADVAAGSYPIVVRSGQWSAEASLTVSADPVVYDPSVVLTPSSVSVSDLADTGVIVSGSGFPEGAAAEVLFDGAVVGSVTTNANGAMSFDLVRADVAAGSYPIVVRSGQWSAEASLTVSADPVVYDPSVELTPSSLSVSDLADAGVVVSGSGFPEGAAAEVLFDGAVVGSVTVGADGAMSFDLVRAHVAAGSYPVVVRSGQWSAEATLTVSADPVEPEPEEIEVSLSAESLSQAQLAGDGVVVSGTGFPAGAQARLLLDGEELAVMTADDAGAVEYRISGLELEPGEYTVELASGTASASATLTVTADPIEYDPVVSIQPTSVTVAELTEQGVLVSGSGFPADAEVEVLFDGEAVEIIESAAPIGPDGEISFRLMLANVEPGDHEVTVRAGGEEAEASLTVSANPVEPEPEEIEVSLSAESLSQAQLAGDGVVVTGAGLPAGAQVRLLLDGEELAVMTADDAGAVEYRISGLELEPGDYTVELVSGTASASTVLTVTADEPVIVPGPSDPSDPGVGGDDDGLANTGADAAWIAFISAFALILIGAGTTMMMRRREVRRS